MDHLFDIDNTKIIDRCDKREKLLTLESCYIKTTKNTINVKKDTENIHPSYASVFNTLEQVRKMKTNTKTQVQKQHTKNIINSITKFDTGGKKIQKL